jgi:hypothetical protein
MKIAHVTGSLMIWSALPSAAAEAYDPKEAFSKSLEGNFQLLDDTWTKVANSDDPNAERFWIVRMKPLKPGRYTIVHDCGNPTKRGGWERCEHKYQFSVLPAGTARTQTAFPFNGNGGSCPTACLGDAVILTFDLRPRYDDHHWTVEKDLDDEIKRVAPQNNATETAAIGSIRNRVDKYLRVVSIGKIPAPSPTIGPAKEYATISFEAIAPAKFTLELQGQGPYRPMTVPIVVVAKDTKLNVFISTASERFYDVAGGSSHGTWAALRVEAYVLRPGDILRVVGRGGGVRCNSLPFVMPDQRYFWKDVKWKDY